MQIALQMLVINTNITHTSLIHTMYTGEDRIPYGVLWLYTYSELGELDAYSNSEANFHLAAILWSMI